MAMRNQGETGTMAARAGFGAALAALLLGSCISLGGDPPERLLTLTPSATAAAGTPIRGEAGSAVAVLLPSASQRLNVTRVPVQIDANSLAYLDEAFWVEKPAQLFRQLLVETIRARTSRLVVGDDELADAATTQLAGELMEMGYDVPSGSVTVRYQAVLSLPGGEVRAQRFENTVSGVSADATSVGPALNQAANAVAVEVADWVNQAPVGG